MATLMLRIVLAIVVALSARAEGQGLGRPARLSDQVDIFNSTQLHEYKLALKQKHFSQKQSCPPSLLPNDLAGRLSSPFAGLSLKSRQSCTGNQNNYCFGSASSSYCSDCGICCTQSAGPWCCITDGGSVVKTCCPADTGLANGQQGCCFTWQTCDSSTGCTDPSTTVTTTITSWSTAYGTSTSIATSYVTSIIPTTIWSTVYTTISNAQTATEIVRTTLSSANQRRTADLIEAKTTATPKSNIAVDTSKLAPVSVLFEQAPVLTLLAYPEYDPVARDLQTLGVIVKRQTTITTTNTATAYATTTIQSIYTSVFVSTIYKTSTANAVMTSTKFVDAKETVTSTSTITPSPKPTTQQTPTSGTTSSSTSTTSEAGGVSGASNEGGSSSDGGGGGGGLSTGAEVGIGVGTAGGSLIICIILFFWWRRRRPSKDKDTDTAAAAAIVAAGGDPHPSHQRKSELPVGQAAPMGETNRYSYRGSSPGLPPYQSAYSYQPVSTVALGADGQPQRQHQHQNYYGGSPAEVAAHEQSQMPQQPAHAVQEHRQGFQYAPYELYDERPQELYSARYERDLRMNEAG